MAAEAMSLNDALTFFRDADQFRPSAPSAKAANAFQVLLHAAANNSNGSVMPAVQFCSLCRKISQIYAVGHAEAGIKDDIDKAIEFLSRALQIRQLEDSEMELKFLREISKRCVCFDYCWSAVC